MISGSLDLDLGDKELLIQIVEKTFLGLKKMSNKTSNNFLEVIDEIPLFLNNSQKYSYLFRASIKEIELTETDIINHIKTSNVKELKRLGLTDNNLKLKVQLLNERLFLMNSFIKNKANFRLKEVVKQFIQEITHLIDLFESLKIINIYLEALIEFLKVLKTLLKLVKK